MSITDSPSSQLAPHREGHAFDLVGGASSRSGPPVHPAPPAATPFAYLAYVDGLRAIAVIAVVLYHAHIPGFGGGFLGVDVFFVISGYLITGLLWKELQTTGRVSMVAFYARRARRLLPALAATLTLTSAAAVVLLLPDPELRWFGQSVLASATFTSNVFFFLKTNGYFGAEAELQPLLHTWSLAVEEQFYIVWPLLLLASVKLGRWRTRDLRKTVRAVTLATVIASLLLALVLERSNPSMAFFLAPSRFWELGVGAFLALGTGSRPALARIPLASVGMLLVLGVIAAAPVLPLSGAPLTLLAVLGTALTLLGAANAPQGRTASFLSIPALVWTGKHSYSWYLLHWPALVLVRVTTMEASAVRDFAIALLTLALAAVFVKVIEGPFRQPASAGTPRHGRTLLVAGVVSVVMAIAGLVGSIRSDTIARIELTASERSALVENRTARNSCPNQPGAAPAVDCAFSASMSPAEWWGSRDAIPGGRQVPGSSSAVTAGSVSRTA